MAFLTFSGFQWSQQTDAWPWHWTTTGVQKFLWLQIHKVLPGHVMVRQFLWLLLPASLYILFTDYLLLQAEICHLQWWSKLILVPLRVDIVMYRCLALVLHRPSLCVWCACHVGTERETQGQNYSTLWQQPCAWAHEVVTTVRQWRWFLSYMSCVAQGWLSYSCNCLLPSCLYVYQQVCVPEVQLQPRTSIRFAVPRSLLTSEPSGKLVSVIVTVGWCKVFASRSRDARKKSTIWQIWSTSDITMFTVIVTATSSRTECFLEHACC